MGLLKVGTVETLESLCTFVSTLDDFFDAAEWRGDVRPLVLFGRLKLLSEDSQQSSRIRVLIKNVLDKRNSRYERLDSPTVAPKRHPPVLLGRTASMQGGSGHAKQEKSQAEEGNKKEQKQKELGRTKEQ